jgi:glutamine amidotransferase
LIAIVDYGAGNLHSVVRAVAATIHTFTVTSDPATVETAPAAILPGVGAAGDTMRSLERLGLIEPVKKLIAGGRPFLGVCVGLQVLFEASEEGGTQPCLGVLPGRVRRLPAGLKVPHMGWNQVRQRMGHPIFEGIPDNANFYFVHSYYAEPADPSIVAGETEYGLTFCSAIARNNLFAVQFHPEKSSALGLRIYDNFGRLALRPSSALAEAR